MCVLNTCGTLYVLHTGPQVIRLNAFATNTADEILGHIPFTKTVLKPDRGTTERPQSGEAAWWLVPQAQRARAARCAVNNTAPGIQPAATVPSRRSSDWRPGPTRLYFNSAPRGVQQQPGLGTTVGETPRTSKPRPATRRNVMGSSSTHPRSGRARWRSQRA
jgi:hypothetical protein